MQFAKPKRKLKAIVIAISLSIPLSTSVNATGIPNFDALNNAANLGQIISVTNKYKNLVMDYADKLHLDKLLATSKMSLSVNLGSTKSQKTLGHTEGLHNLMIDEMSQPIVEICEVVGSKPNSDITNNRVQFVSDLEDIHQAASVGGHTLDVTNIGIKSENGVITEDSSSAPKSTVSQARFERNNAIVFNAKEQKSCLFETYDSKAEWLLACEDQIENATSIEGDYVMNDKAFLSYDENMSKAMMDMVSLIAPPYIAETPEANAMSDEAVVEDMRKAAMTSVASSMMSDVVSRRMAGENSESEMALMDAIDSFYNGDMTTAEEDTMSFKFSNSELSTPSLLLRHMIEMSALRVHLSLMEYKNDINKEISLSNNLINKYKKG